MARNKERKVPEVLIWSDINNYADDLASFVILAYLSDRKLINIRGIITELGVYEVRRRRAMYAKGAMSHLGYPFIRAVPGGDYDIINEQEENHYIENELTPIFENAGLTINRSGTIFLQEYMKTVKERNVFLLFNAPFTDFGKYLKVTGDTILKKVKKIVIMGNVLPERDERGFYQPDLESFNFKYCPESAKLLFDYVQEKDLRTTIVPSTAVKDFKMDYSCLDAVKKSKNPVVKQLIAMKDEANPTTMAYDMSSAMCLVDGVFKSGGGVIEKEEGVEKNISIAKIVDPQAMRDKFCEIFKEKLEPKVLSMEHLKRPKSLEEEEKSNA
ncbi:MAG: hypothetical protein IJ870_05245 [Alphaproteobacteria bacterium]|nr:hypothetical protein [Alphaproteobacteria bacterium]